MITNFIDHKRGERPPINLTVCRVEASTFENLGFAQHHYLTKSINKSAICLLFRWNNEPVAFYAIIHKPFKGHANSMAGHRLVVHPDFQGLGLTSIIKNFTGAIVMNEYGESLTSKTAHDKMGHFMEHSPYWEATAYNGKFRDTIKARECDKKYKCGRNVASYCYKYVGPPLAGYEELFKPIEELRGREEKQLQLSLF